MKHIKKIKNFVIVGGIGAIAAVGLVACDDSGSYQDNQTLNEAVKNGAFVIIEQDDNGNYTILEEYPSTTTRVVLRDKATGNERILSDAEIKELIAQEERKIDDNESSLTNPQMQGTGMSLGGAILSSAAGALLGSYIGNKLFGNQNFQAAKQRAYSSPAAYSRSQNSFAKNKAATANSTKRKSSGFFGGGSSTSKASS